MATATEAPARPDVEGILAYSEEIEIGKPRYATLANLCRYIKWLEAKSCNCRSLPEPAADDCPVHGDSDDTNDHGESKHQYSRDADSALCDEDGARVAQAEYDQRWYR